MIQQEKFLPSQWLIRQVCKAQSNEMTEYLVYFKLADWIGSKNDQQVLRRIAEQEKLHAQFWQTYTQKIIGPSRIKTFLYYFLARFLGLTFTVKLMEKGEKQAQINYSKIAELIPEAKTIEKEESEHESQLLNILDEESLRYVGSMILGVNDALVQLTGVLAGFTFALQNTKLISLTGLITGIAAALSMAGSEYLSVKAERENKRPFKAALYTGIMYLVTAVLLILPYFLLSNLFLALGLTLSIAILIILFFTFYISVVQDLPFKRRFFEMAGISFGVSALTFLIGFLIMRFLGVAV